MHCKTKSLVTPKRCDSCMVKTHKMLWAAEWLKEMCTAKIHVITIHPRWTSKANWKDRTFFKIQLSKTDKVIIFVTLVHQIQL